MADAGAPLMLDAATRRGVLAAAATGLLPLLLQLPPTIGMTIAAAAVVVTALSFSAPSSIAASSTP